MQLSPAVRFRTRPGDLDDWQDSLIAGVSATDIADDFVQEASDELTDREDLLAKLRAAFSASALAVNTFGPHRHHPELLSMAGLSGFSETRFEYPCPNGLSGTYPHFDFWDAARNGVLAVASTFLEPLDPETYRYLDAAQLMKYYLGMKHSYPDRRRVRGLETNFVALLDFIDILGCPS